MKDSYALAHWGFSGFTATDDYALTIENESKVDTLNRERHKELHERFADALNRLQVTVMLMGDGKVIVGVCDATNDPSVTPEQAHELALADAHRKRLGQPASADRQHVVELPTMSQVLGPLPADQRETAANVLLMCKQAVLDSGAAVKMGAWSEGDAAVAELVQEAMQDVAGGKTYTHEEAKQLMAERRAKVEASKPTCTDERPCVNCFSGQGECEVKQEADDLTQFLEQTDFDAAEKVASDTVAKQQALPAGEDDCEGCKI